MLEDGQDLEHRFGWLIVWKGLEIFGLCNLYALREEDSRRGTWSRMQDLLDCQYRWFIGGDFNFIEAAIDWLGRDEESSTHVPVSWHSLRDIHLHLGDPWVFNPAQRQQGSLIYSWNNGSLDASAYNASRLDRIYLSLDWMDRVEQYGIIGGTLQSDHAPYFQTIELARGGTLEVPSQ